MGARQMQISVDEYVSRLNRQIDAVERARESIEAGDIVLDDKGTLWSAEGWLQHTQRRQKRGRSKP